MNLLFVDDEPMALRALERTLSSLSSDWTMYFSTSAEDAWRILDEHIIDVVVTDMRMPDIDGSTFLSSVKRRQPEVIRLILSGFKDEDAAIRSTESAHRLLAKPIMGADLVDEIRITTETQPARVSLRKIVNGTMSLLSPAHVTATLTETLSMSNATPQAIASIVTSDPALTAKILQLGNSAFFGPGLYETDIVRCIETIGIDTLRAVASCDQLFRSLPADDSRSAVVDNTHQHASTGGAGVGYLLHAVGRLLLIDASEPDPVCGCESSDTLSLSLALTRLWGIPEDIIESMLTSCPVKLS